MRGKDLLECMEYVDDALIQEALEPNVVLHRNKTYIIAKWGMAAACAAVMGISATTFWSHNNVQEQSSDSAAPIVMDNTAAGTDSGSVGNMAESIPAEGNMASDTQNDMATTGEEAASSSTASGNTELAKHSSQNDTESAQENAAKDVELQDELRDMAESESKRLSYTVIHDYYGEKDDAVYSNSVPEKGKIIFDYYLQEAMEYYTAQESTSDTVDGPVYAYEIVIVLYGDVEKGGSELHYGQLNMLDNLDTSSEKIEQEYVRLAEIGYAVRLSEDFQLTGTFTKVELDTFQASPEYGYTFRFANEY